MTLETSTMNILLSGVIGLQVYIVREIFSLKAQIQVITDHCDHCRPRRGGGLASLLAVLLLLPAAGALAQEKQITLEWDFYAPEVATNTTHNPDTGTVTGASIVTNWPQFFTLRGTTNAAQPLTAWPILTNIPGTVTNAGAITSQTKVTLAATEPARFFVLTVTLRGIESPFSNTASAPTRPAPGSGLKASRPW